VLCTVWQNQKTIAFFAYHKKTYYLCTPILDYIYNIVEEFGCLQPH